MGFAASENLGGIVDTQAGMHWDAATFAAEITRRVAELSRLGISPGTRVAIVHGGSAAFFADLLAVWRLGATAACIDPALTAAELANVVAFTGPKLALVSRTSPVPAGISSIDLGTAPAGSVPAAMLPDPAASALVLFTSGTTGNPKGVMLSYGALEARIAANISVIGKPALACALVTLPTHFGHGLIGNALTALFAGGTILLPPAGMGLARDLGAIIDRHRVTFMSSVPALWRMALKLGSVPKQNSLVRIHVGSAPLSAALWSDIAAWARCETVNCYGMTETANWFAGASSRDRIEDGLLGMPWSGAAAVRDGNGSVEREGEGEIVVRTPSLMSGYLDRPDLTAAAIRDGWYHTGDRGRIENGSIWLTGRIKDEINRAGFKVQPAEIDRLLEAHPAVAEACTFGLMDAVGGEVVAAAVQAKEGCEVDPQGMRSWCLERLRREAVPERWYVVDQIPRTARGKVSRDAVRRRLAPDSP